MDLFFFLRSWAVSEKRTEGVCMLGRCKSLSPGFLMGKAGLELIKLLLLSPEC